MPADEALQIASQADELFATKGKHVVHLQLKRDRPDQEAILAAMLGPSGNLRAPTLRVGRTLIVGFDRALYEELLT